MYRLLIVAFVCIIYMTCKNDDQQLSLLEVPTLSYQDTMTDRGKEIITHRTLMWLLDSKLTTILKNTSTASS